MATNGNMNTGNPNGQIYSRGNPSVSQGLGGYQQGQIAQNNLTKDYFRQGGYLSESINELRQMKDTYEEMAKVISKMTKTEENSKRKLLLEYKKQLQYLEAIQKVGYISNEDAIDSVNETNKLLVKGQTKYIELLQKVKEEYKDIQEISEDTIEQAINEQTRLTKKYKDQKVIFNDINKILNNAPKDWSSALVKNMKSVKDELMNFSNMFNLQTIANSSLQQSARNKAQIMSDVSKQLGFTSTSQFESFKSSLNSTLWSMNSSMGGLFNSTDMKEYMSNLSTYGITNKKMAEEQMRNSIIATKYLGVSAETQTAMFKFMKLTNNNDVMENYNKSIVNILKADLGVSKEQLDALTQMAVKDQDALMASGMSAETYAKYLNQYDTAGAVLTNMYGQDVAKSIMSVVSEFAASSYYDADTLIRKYGPNSVSALTNLKNTGDVMSFIQTLTSSAAGWGQGQGSNINNATYQAALGANNSSALVAFNYLSSDISEFTSKASQVLDGSVSREELEEYIKETTPTTAVDKIANWLDTFLNGIPWKWTMGLANAALVAYLAAKPFEIYSYFKNLKLTSLLTTQLGEGGVVGASAGKLAGGGAVVGLTASTVAGLAIGIASAAKNVYGSGKNEQTVTEAVLDEGERADKGAVPSFFHDVGQFFGGLGGIIEKGFAGQLLGDKSAEAKGAYTMIMAKIGTMHDTQDALLLRLAALMLFDKGNTLQYLDVDENHGDIARRYNGLSQDEKETVKSWAVALQDSAGQYIRDYNKNIIDPYSIDWANYHKAGKDYIPRDNYKALLHKGEMVLNARDAAQYRAERNVGGQSDDLYGKQQKIILGSVVPSSTDPGYAGSLMGLPSGWYITSAYGTYTNIRDNSGRIKIHRGIDFAASLGTPIRAAHGGTVYLSSGDGYGNSVRIATDSGLFNRYGHLSRFAPGLSNGAVVKRGQLIGYVGSTGNSTGPHLHFQVNKTNNEHDDINPWPYVMLDMFGGSGSIGVDDVGVVGTSTGTSNSSGVVKVPQAKRFVPLAFQHGGVGGNDSATKISGSVNSGINRIIDYLESVREEQKEQRELINAFSQSRMSESNF